MCIGPLTNLHPEPEGTGYKLFILRENEVASPFFDLFDYRYPLETWIADQRKDQIQSYTEDYPGEYKLRDYETGFHIFFDLDHAKQVKLMFDDLSNKQLRYVVLKVQYRKAVVEGQFFMASQETTCVVAKEMYVEKEILFG